MYIYAMLRDVMVGEVPYLQWMGSPLYIYPTMKYVCIVHLFLLLQVIAEFKIETIMMFFTEVFSSICDNMHTSCLTNVN